MKKPLVVAVVIIVIIIGGFAYLMMNGKDEPTSTSPSTDSSQPTAPQAAPTPAGETPKAGQYRDYDAAAVAATTGEKVLFFHASWCPQCRQLESEIKAGPLPDNTTIFKVDYDSNQALRQKYGVTLQTTLVKVDGQGNLVEKYVAYDDPTLESIKENIL